MKKLVAILFLSLSLLSPALAEEPVKVGLGAVLSGNMAFFGQGDLQGAELYLKHYKRHNIKLVPEDVLLTSAEGLRAYQKLVNSDKVDVLIAAGSSNGIMAVKSLVNSSRTPTLMASTGGNNIDKAGPWMFRVGNSDTLNGTQQAEYFLENGIQKVALLTELTEYTVDISKFFREKFEAGGGKLVYDDQFLPNTADFRTQATAVLNKKPDAVFMPTQTGTALGIFIKQLRQQEKGSPLEVHTTMVAAPNPDAHSIAGDDIIGVYYMDPSYGRDTKKYKEFLGLYIIEYGQPPAADFHVASVLDCLEHLQNFLDKNAKFDKEKFAEYLLNDVGSYCGYMGCYTFDSEGNTDIGFQMAKITQNLSKK